jgi:hypothetical protein
MDDEEALGPSPCKNGTFRPIFNDSPLKPPEFGLGNEKAKARAKTVSRTNSLPPGMQLFGKKKGDPSKRVEKMKEGHVRAPLPTPSSSKRKRSGSGTGPE